ncbi:hypothetical protein [Vibrio parahaemolyticus]|uniref:hypothetical protein n=1 Tax=Vibrio parahaemolyticus TaxID=670 RepID=UPI002B21545A|nr:hypothetical protein [Vibrio parahaemolyticus]MEA5245057.1 hypothetical protein [Vibrio parahaemolyticus]
MIKVEYILDEQEGELDLAGLTSFSSKEEVVESWGKSTALAHYLVEDTLAILKPEVDSFPMLYACERGGERNVISPESQAREFGFTKFIAKLDNQTLTIC